MPFYMHAPATPEQMERADPISNRARSRAELKCLERALECEIGGLAKARGISEEQLADVILAITGKDDYLYIPALGDASRETVARCLEAWTEEGLIHAIETGDID